MVLSWLFQTCAHNFCFLKSLKVYAVQSFQSGIKYKTIKPSGLMLFPSFPWELGHNKHLPKVRKGKHRVRFIDCWTKTHSLSFHLCVPSQWIWNQTIKIWNVTTWSLNNIQFLCLNKLLGCFCSVSGSHFPCNALDDHFWKTVLNLISECIPVNVTAIFISSPKIYW